MNLLSRLLGRRKSERVEWLTPPNPQLPKLPLREGEEAARNASTEERNSALSRLLLERDALRQQLKHATAKVEFTPGRDLVVVLAFCAADEHRMRELLRWIAELGQVQATALAVVPKSYTGWARMIPELVTAFDRHFTVKTPFDLPKEGWPLGPNWSFLTAAEHCRRTQSDFLWLEPDCIPLRSGWFEAIRDAYRAAGKPYLGFIEPGTNDYPRHLTGNAVYHHGVFHHFRTDQLGRAWDIAMADTLLPLAAATPLIHQEFGPLDRPPVFHTVDDLRRIPQEAALFHRNKDGSLIRVLRERRERDEQKETEGPEELS